MDFVSPADGPYILYQGKKWLDFSSCDFLGLSQHPEVKKAAIKSILKYGVGIPTAPLASLCQQELEQKLARFLGVETALLLGSIEQTHQIVKNQKGVVISAEEDVKPKKSQGLLCLDESFTIGMTGDQGFGVAAQRADFTFICGSLAHGIGCTGAFIAGSKKYLSEVERSSVLSFAELGALDSALSFVPEMTQERETVEKYLHWFQKEFDELSFKVYKSPRLFFNFKSDAEAEKARAVFAQDQIYLAPPIGHQLYIAFTALHTPDDLDQLATALKRGSSKSQVLSGLF